MIQELMIDPYHMDAYEKTDLNFGDLTLRVSRIDPLHLTQSLHRIKEARNRILLTCSMQEIISGIDNLAKRWLNHQDPIRQKAMELMPYTTRLSKEHLSIGLDLVFREITAPKLEELINAKASTNNLHHGPELITHIFAGIIPTPCLFNLVLALLSRSASFLKCPSIEPVFPYLLYQTLYETHPDLAQCVLVSWWKGSEREIEDRVFKESDIICAYGRNETLQDIRNRIPITTRFIPYGNRVSLGVVLKEACENLEHIAQNAAMDICLFDQQGCLSPHLIYVESPDMTLFSEFSAFLATAMQTM
ncbi:MAG: acyl-CoA reductase, partial [Chlamydiota bacterium]|nr:acyl-CoA reductase [Chlamydiota bacterium]